MTGLLLATAIITVIVVIALIFSVSSRGKKRRKHYLIEDKNPVYDQVQIKRINIEPNIAYFKTSSLAKKSR